jgi:hypothetical protein
MCQIWDFNVHKLVPPEELNLMRVCNAIFLTKRSGQLNRCVGSKPSIATLSKSGTKNLFFVRTNQEQEIDIASIGSMSTLAESRRLTCTKLRNVVPTRRISESSDLS